ncbi:MAG: hypothetical protein HY078_12520 [Elusimicrobia bacterium]|nr:hypothetical protein [Elusimicrobiota bacterium]
MAKEKKQDAEKEAVPEKVLEQLILDRSHGKYALVPMASVWALELRRQEEHRHLTQIEILDMALRDLLTGKVSAEQVEKAAAAAAVIAARAAADTKEKK